MGAAALGARVTATDLESTLPLLRRNVERNAAVIAAQGGSCDVVPLRWGEPPPEPLQLRGASFVLLSDCIFTSELVEPMLDTLCCLCGGDDGGGGVGSWERAPVVSVLLANERREPERNRLAEHAFHEAVARSGLWAVEEVPGAELDPEYSDPSIYVCRMQLHPAGAGASSPAPTATCPPPHGPAVTSQVAVELERHTVGECQRILELSFHKDPARLGHYIPLPPELALVRRPLRPAACCFDWDFHMRRLFLSRNIEGATDAGSGAPSGRPRSTRCSPPPARGGSAGIWRTHRLARSRLWPPPSHTQSRCPTAPRVTSLRWVRWRRTQVMDDPQFWNVGRRSTNDLTGTYLHVRGACSCQAIEGLPPPTSVRPDHRRQGYAATAVRRAFTELATAPPGVDVMLWQTGEARGFYEKLGARVVPTERIVNGPPWGAPLREQQCWVGVCCACIGSHVLLDDGQDQGLLMVNRSQGHFGTWWRWSTRRRRHGRSKGK
jgi:GNAT superfamily N-acetyltransferase